MKLFTKLMIFFVVLAFPVMGQAEEAKKPATAPAMSSVDKMQKMLEYHQKMVSKIQAYMKDRAQIPADYRAVSDNEFLKRVRSERMVMPKNEGSPASRPGKPASNPNPYSN